MTIETLDKSVCTVIGPSSIASHNFTVPRNSIIVNFIRTLERIGKNDTFVIYASLLGEVGDLDSRIALKCALWQVEAVLHTRIQLFTQRENVGYRQDRMGIKTYSQLVWLDRAIATDSSHAINVDRFTL